VNLLTPPIDLEAWALDDLGAIARVARELPERLDTLEARTERVREQFDRALVIGETIADNSAAMVELAER
jgi:glycogen debranching enzyme